MTLHKTNADHAKRVSLLVKSKTAKTTQQNTGIWHWVNGVASSVGHFFGKVLGPFSRIASDNVAFDARFFHDVAGTWWKAFTWWDRFVLHKYLDLLHLLERRQDAKEARDFNYLQRLIYVVSQALIALITNMVRHEAAQRERAITQTRHLARLWDKHLHHTIEREAASGYASEQSGRTDLIVKLLELAGVRIPGVQAIVGDLTTGILDLATIDDPVLRFTIGFLIKHLIDRMGIEKPLGHLIDDLLAPILGDPKPHDLHDVIADIAKRLGAVEGQWATFFGDGGSEVEQAGRDWQAITSVATSLAIVAFTADAVVNPDGWARDIQATIGTAAGDVATAATALFRG